MTTTETDVRILYVSANGECVVDSATTIAQIEAVSSLACALTDPDSGEPLEGWTWANDPDEPRTLFQFILGDRRVRVDQKTFMADRPPFAVATVLDGIVIRLEMYEGHDALECTYDFRSPPLRGKELPRWMETDPQAYDPVAFLQQAFGVPPEISKPMLQATHDPGMPGLAPSYRPDPTVPSDVPDEVTPENTKSFHRDGKKVVRMLRLKATGLTYCGDGIANGADMEAAIEKHATVITLADGWSDFNLREVCYEIEGLRRYCYIWHHVSIDDWCEECWTTDHRLTEKAAMATLLAARRVPENSARQMIEEDDD